MYVIYNLKIKTEAYIYENIYTHYISMLTYTNIVFSSFNNLSYDVEKLQLVYASLTFSPSLFTYYELSVDIDLST